MVDPDSGSVASIGSRSVGTRGLGKTILPCKVYRVGCTINKREYEGIRGDMQGAYLCELLSNLRTKEGYKRFVVSSRSCAGLPYHLSAPWASGREVKVQDTRRKGQ